MVRLFARLLAPLALAAVAVGVYLIVNSTISKPHSTSTPSATTLQTTGRRHHRAKPRPKFYVVKQGDTLSAIAQKTGVSLTRLSALNPAVSSPPTACRPVSG